MASLPKGSGIPTIVEGAEDGATFQVEVSAHLMSLLAGLYSRREDSIVREVLSNAYDAQISIGVDAPVVIEAPSTMSPVLKIRDRGPGMAKATVFKVYASYGTSTKANSEEQTGGMGVGAKAVFCYTDTFTVISWHGGMESTYVAYMNGETGIPRIDLMASVECPIEKTGVEVQLPIQMTDIQTFTDAIAWNSQFHATPPIVVGGAAVKAMYDQATICWDLESHGAPGWRAYGGWEHDQGVVMGSVFYPLTQNAPSMGFPVVLTAPMGAVRFAPSREALKYDEVTVRELRRANAALNRAYEVWVNGLIASVETRFTGYPGEQNRALAQIATKPKFEGILKAEVLKSAMGDAVSKRFHPGLLSTGSIPGRLTIDLMLFDAGQTRRSIMASDKPLHTDYLTVDCWVNDCPGGEARLRKALAEKTVGTGIFYTRDASLAKTLALHLGFNPDTFVYYTSALPEIPKAPRVPRSSTRVGGKLGLYPDVSKLTGSVAAVQKDGDEAIDLTEGVYVEAMVGGKDWTSESEDKKLSLRNSNKLEAVLKRSAWCDMPLTGPVLRLNAADREKLRKKGIPLTPLAERMKEAIDWDAARQAARDWITLGENLWHRAYSSTTRTVLESWSKLPESVQTLLVDHLNKADAGLGDLVLEAVARSSLWGRPGVGNDTLKERIAEVVSPTDKTIEARLSALLSNLDISRLGGSSASRYMAAMLALCGALSIPEAALGRALCPALAPVARPKAKAKATAGALPGQLSLFETPEDPPLMLRAAA